MFFFILPGPDVRNSFFVIRNRPIHEVGVLRNAAFGVSRNAAFVRIDEVGVLRNAALGVSRNAAFVRTPIDEVSCNKKMADFVYCLIWLE